MPESYKLIEVAEPGTTKWQFSIYLSLIIHTIFFFLIESIHNIGTFGSLLHATESLDTLSVQIEINIFIFLILKQALFSSNKWVTNFEVGYLKRASQGKNSPMINNYLLF